MSTGGEDSVTRGGKSILRQIDYMPMTDEDNLRRASMDNTDFDDEPLNEKALAPNAPAAWTPLPRNSNNCAVASNAIVSQSCANSKQSS